MFNLGDQTVSNADHVRFLDEESSRLQGMFCSLALALRTLLIPLTIAVQTTKRGLGFSFRVKVVIFSVVCLRKDEFG